MSSDNEKFTHVCTHCYSPVRLDRPIFAIILKSLVQLALAALLIVLAGPIGIAIILIWFFLGPRLNQCRDCGNRTLVHVRSPRGLKIMANEGWHPQEEQ